LLADLTTFFSQSVRSGLAAFARQHFSISATRSIVSRLTIWINALCGALAAEVLVWTGAVPFYEKLKAESEGLD
jgi:hypothetical protein